MGSDPSRCYKHGGRPSVPISVPDDSETETNMDSAPLAFPSAAPDQREGLATRESRRGSLASVEEAVEGGIRFHAVKGIGGPVEGGKMSIAPFPTEDELKEAQKKGCGFVISMQVRF